ncbi:hypothetical protein BDB00DRAFT_803905 [Zychaea mexicana]|uniref:uncharacterized protein n=1 Tax=Zychaea mexicana TaxID=64656 RepID=UPI0022FDE74C|nr:uncharacterized protein BDB00DRAFT_803905 [Zychaea mexicana]KAI9497759.1 hypothetical protein BDB00DRAFT_803905 [Zychaea mexicana]
MQRVVVNCSFFHLFLHRNPTDFELMFFFFCRCRRRHVKCDEQRPKCSNCVKSNAECSYSHSGMRYDHISAGQRRDDMYTEIDDISKRVESLLSTVQNQKLKAFSSQPTHDDVARLAIDYGWQVFLTSDGQKRILTNIETTAQLAALVPRALNDVYGDNNNNSSSSHATITSTSSPASSHDSLDSQVVRLPVRMSLNQYLQPYDNTGATPTTDCPSMFAFVMSPSLIRRMSGYPDLSVSVTGDLYCCPHNTQGYFPPLPPSGSLSTAVPTHVLAQRTRFSDCSLSNVFWNLIKTAQLIDHGNFSQAYVNTGITITKAFNLRLHRSSTTTHHEQQGRMIDAEVVKRIFWAVWLLDTQMPLLHERQSSIQLQDIQIDPPVVCQGMADDADIAYTDCLRWLIEARRLRIKIEHNLTSMNHEKDEHKVLNIVTQQIRQLRRFYEHLDTKYKLETMMMMVTIHTEQWQRRTMFMVLLEHAMNWLVLFDRFLPALPDPTMTAGTKFPDNLTVSMCRQAADVMTVVFEKWIWDGYDCQFRLYLNHFCNTISMHKVILFLYFRTKRMFELIIQSMYSKYVCRCPGVSTVHKWKAYASLQFLRDLTRKTPEIVQSFLGQRILEDVTFALQDLSEVTENGWNPLEQTDLLRDMTHYFSGWTPSCDPIATDENTSLLGKESSTMFAIIEMRKSAAAFSTMMQQQQQLPVQQQQEQLML